MEGRRLAAALLAVVLALVPAVLTGCGGGGEEAAPPAAEPPPAEPPPAEEPPAEEPPAEEPPAAEGDPAAGAEVWNSAGCGGCHTLAAAGATGTIGPSLDERKPAFDLVVERVTNGKPPMPSFKDSLSEQQTKDVAAYVVQSTSG